MTDVQKFIVEMSHARESKVVAAPEVAADEEIALHTRRADLRARTDRQAQYIRQMQTHDITFGVGPAGTGKTYLAVACAVDAFERDLVKRIVASSGAPFGLQPGHVTAKSLRASGAMALLIAQVDQDLIRLIGRWKSDSMLRYLHISALPVLHNHAKSMWLLGDYTFHPAAS